MIADSDTNKLYLSSRLEECYPKFYDRFKKVLDDCNIPVELLQHTKDIWAKDYMPVQVSKNKFIRFRYDPDYLDDLPELKTDSKPVCEAIALKYENSPINLDGGNVVRRNKKAIMCDKVFKENKKNNGDIELIKNLIDLLGVDKLIFVPWEGKKYDCYGHSDGMVRFIDDNTVLINDYDYHRNPLIKALKDANLELVPLPCDNTLDMESAVGYYINYLQMEQAIIMPTFKGKNPDKAMRILEQRFPKKKIVTVESDDVAKEGGVLNCISWNVKRNS